MKFKYTILALIFISTIIESSAQPKHSLAQGLYMIDKKIDVQIKKYSFADSGALKNSMAIKVLWNTRNFFNQSLDCMTKSYLKNDTIYIIGHMLSELGYGFQLMLFKDSCITASFGLSDGKVYKYNKSDTDSTDFIPLPSISYKVILSRKPAYENGEIVAGFVELKSIPFYYASLEGKFKIELLAYFKTTPLKKVE